MTKTKEYNEAVEKVGKSLLDRVYQGGLPITYSDAHKVFTELAKTAINALNIEIVSRKSEIQSGDCVQEDIYGNLYCLESKMDIKWGEDRKMEIIKRNSKPAVYVENIGDQYDGK